MFLKLIKKNKGLIKYSDLSTEEQKKILEKTIREANEEQLALVKTFDRQCAR